MERILPFLTAWERLRRKPSVSQGPEIEPPGRDTGWQRDIRAIQVSHRPHPKDLSQCTPCRNLGPRWPIVTELVGIADG
jgi:hypothetical protein